VVVGLESATRGERERETMGKRLGQLDQWVVGVDASENRFIPSIFSVSI
jgi:hypothetical protein